MPAKNRNDLKDPRYRAARKWVLDNNPQCVVPGCHTPADTVDHIVPVSLGGDPYLTANMQPMCNKHNGQKGARLTIPRVDWVNPRYNIKAHP